MSEAIAKVAIMATGSTAYIAIVMAGTWHNNSDLWDKFQAEMRALSNLRWWLVELLNRMEACHHAKSTYEGRHRSCA